MRDDYAGWRPPGGVVAMVGGAIVFVLVLGVLVGACDGGFTSTQGGERAVVRNGGPLDNKKIRQVIEPASSLTWTGLFSDAHKYPASQRYLRISSDAAQSESGRADQTLTPTSDGVNVNIEGTVYFEFTSDTATLRQFDDRFGVRKFGGHHPYEGDEGFQAFLNEQIGPIVFANLRQQIARQTCVDLISSCGLVQSRGRADVKAGTGAVNNANVSTIEEAVSTALESQVRETLGGPYLTNVKFQMRVALPPTLEKAVDDARAAFAEVSKSSAKVRSARNEAKANSVRQRGYSNCPTCAEIDARKAIPGGIQVWAPGNSKIAVGAGR